MRLLAGELKAKAAEIEKQATIEAHILDRDSHLQGQTDATDRPNKVDARISRAAPDPSSDCDAIKCRPCTAR